MPKGSPERTAARKEEIISACEKLYQTMSFKDITLKEIGNETSFPDQRYTTIIRQKKRYSWLSLKGSIFAGTRNLSLFFRITKSFQRNSSLRNWRHPLQTDSSS